MIEFVEHGLHELWRRGQAWQVLLDEGQQGWFQRFESGDGEEIHSSVWGIGRQRGKSFAAVYDANDCGTQRVDWILRYCALTKDSCAGIVRPAMAEMAATMPLEMRPIAVGDYEWLYPQTNARLVIFGTDAESFRKGRGPRTHRQYLDECGFYQDLVGVESALMPALQTTRGKVLYLSTPPESLGHAYVERWRAHQASGRFEHDTFFNNPRVNPEAVIAFECARLGLTREQLLASSYFRREYLAELVAEESRAAIPAWNEDMHKRCVGDWVRPTYFDAYEAIDPGRSHDPHAALFAYHNPEDARLYVFDEVEMRSSSVTVAGIAAELKARERAHFGADRWDGTLLGAADWQREFGDLPEFLRKAVSDKAPRQPFLRVADNENAVLNALSAEHGIAAIPTRKDDKHLAVDAVVELFRKDRIRITRNCVRLLEQLYSTVWNKTRTEWERTARDHGDLIDCLVYLCRNVRWHRDCRPPRPPDSVHLLPDYAKPRDERSLAHRLSALRGGRSR